MSSTKQIRIGNGAGIGAYNFLLHNVLAGGASRSLRTDSQGKALASAWLQIKFARPDGWERMMELFESLVGRTRRCGRDGP